MQRKYKTIGSLTIISLSATLTNTLTYHMLIVGSKHNNATVTQVVRCERCKFRKGMKVNNEVYQIRLFGALSVKRTQLIHLLQLTLTRTEVVKWKTEARKAGYSQQGYPQELKQLLAALWDPTVVYGEQQQTVVVSSLTEEDCLCYSVCFLHPRAASLPIHSQGNLQTALKTTKIKKTRISIRD